MKLIITYPVGDEYTYSSTTTICIEYESEEKLLLDIEVWAIKHKGENLLYCGSGFNGTDLFPEDYLDNLEFNSFKIRTLEQWFEDESK